MEPPFMKGYWDNPENLSPTRARRSSHEKKFSPSRHERRDNLPPPRRDSRNRPLKSRVKIPVKFVDDSPPSKSRFQAKKKKSYNNWRPKMSATTAAVKIQAAYRGFGVRKSAPLQNLKAIAQAKYGMEEAKRRINDERVVKLISQNEKERLKITEGLMSLLLKLDAIQGANTIVRESRKAVIRELIKLQETVDVITTDKTMESEPPTKDVEESVLPVKESFLEEEHVPMDIHTPESIATAPPNTDLNSLENALQKKFILNDLENALEKKIILGENENENNQDLPIEKNPETSPKMKIPEEKEEMGSLDENMDSSGPAKDSSKPLKDFSEPLNDYADGVKDSSEPVRDSSVPVTSSTGEDVNDDDDVSIDNQEQGSSDLPQMESNESGSAEEDFRSANREAILEEAFEVLDQIKLRIAEGQSQKDNEVPLQRNEAANIVEQDEVKLKEVINEPEHGIHSMECSEECHAGEDTSNQGKLSKQDGIPEENNSLEGACVKKSEVTNNDGELSQQDGIHGANTSEEAACVKKSEDTDNNTKSFSDKPENDGNKSRDERTTTAVENVWEENKKLKKVIEDLYTRNQMQNDIMGNISKKLEQLEKRMLQLNNNRKRSMGKRKRT